MMATSEKVNSMVNVKSQI